MDGRIWTDELVGIYLYIHKDKQLDTRSQTSIHMHLPAELFLVRCIYKIQHDSANGLMSASSPSTASGAQESPALTSPKKRRTAATRGCAAAVAVAVVVAAVAVVVVVAVVVMCLGGSLGCAQQSADLRLA